MSDDILEQLDFAPSCDGANCPYEIKYQGDYPCCDKMVVVCDLHRTAYSFVEKLSKRLSEGDRTYRRSIVLVVIKQLLILKLHGAKSNPRSSSEEKIFD
jgi:hypothetical protein